MTRPVARGGPGSNQYQVRGVPKVHSHVPAVPPSMPLIDQATDYPSQDGLWIPPAFKGTAPPATSVIIKGHRHYKSPRTGQLLPSISTLLELNYKPELDKWRNRVLVDYAISQISEGQWQQDVEKLGLRGARDKLIEDADMSTMGAADNGTNVHARIEAEIGRELGYDVELPEVSSDMEPYMDAYSSWRQHFKVRYRALECTVFHDTIGYAGTSDFLAEVDGQLMFGDYKTGTKLRPSVAQQLHAASHAEYVYGGDGQIYPVPQVEGHIALLLATDGYQPRFIADDPTTFRSFVALKRLWDYSKSQPIGKVMVPKR